MILQCPGRAYPRAKGRDREAARFDRSPRIASPLLGWRGTGEPLGMLIALATKICHPLAAQEGEVALHACLHRPTGEVAIWLIVPLAFQNVRPKRGSVELRCDRR